MGRHLLAAAVVVADTALLAGRLGGLPLWVVPVYALAVASIVVLAHRAPVAAFAVAVAFAALTGGAYVLLLWIAYQAGRHVVSRRGAAVVTGAAVGGFGVQLAVRPGDTRAIPHLVFAYVVFVALPLLVGGYLAQHRRLVSALDRHNRRLRWERELLAEQERLRERLRIARDMHDSLGRRLSLVSIQAAALEVSVPPPHQEAVRRLTTAASGAMDELSAILGTLRSDETRRPGAEAIDEIVGEFRAAGVPVTLSRQGEARPLHAAVGQAAYRVVEEGLTNAAKHAPDQPVAVSIDGEPDGLLVTVVNPLPAGGTAGGAGHGLTGLDERVRAAGGYLDHRAREGEFRLVAMLPVVAPATPDDGLPVIGGVRTAAIGFATAALMFVVLPAGMLLGVG